MANGNQGLIKRWAHRWFIDGLGFMAQGLFASLIIGLMISQLSLIPGLGFLAQFSTVLAASAPVVGAAIGAVIMSSISYLLVFMGFSSNYDNTITGIILITIVVADALMQRRAAVRNRHERLAARTAGTAEGGEAK